MSTQTKPQHRRVTSDAIKLSSDATNQPNSQLANLAANYGSNRAILKRRISTEEDIEKNPILKERLSETGLSQRFHIEETQEDDVDDVTFESSNEGDDTDIYSINDMSQKTII